MIAPEHIRQGSSRITSYNVCYTKLLRIRLAHQENMRPVEHLKRWTTLGMATDQGKTSNVTALAVMAELTGQTLPATGTRNNFV